MIEIDYSHLKKLNLKKLKSNYWLKWTIICFVVSISGGLLFSEANLATSEIFPLSAKWILTWIGLALVIGVLLALGEWVVLPVRFSQLVWWTIVSIAGSLLGFIVVFLFHQFRFSVYLVVVYVGLLDDPNLLSPFHPVSRFILPMINGVIDGMVYGFFIAAMQCLVLANLKRVTPSRWWIIINLIGFAVIGIFNGFFLGMIGSHSQGLAMTMGGLIGLFLLGYLLLLFLHQNVDKLKRLSDLSVYTGLTVIILDFY